MANYRPLIVNTSANQIQELNESVDALMVKEVIGISQNTDKIDLSTSGNMKLKVGGEERINLSSTNAFQAIELRGSTSNSCNVNLVCMSGTLQTSLALGTPSNKDYLNIVASNKTSGTTDNPRHCQISADENDILLRLGNGTGSRTPLIIPSRGNSDTPNSTATTGAQGSELRTYYETQVSCNFSDTGTNNTDAVPLQVGCGAAFFKAGNHAFGPVIEFVKTRVSSMRIGNTANPVTQAFLNGTTVQASDILGQVHGCGTMGDANVNPKRGATWAMKADENWSVSHQPSYHVFEAYSRYGGTAGMKSILHIGEEDSSSDTTGGLTIKLPHVHAGTGGTASGAQYTLYLNSAGQVVRSGSSITLKENLRDITLEQSKNVLNNLRPVKFDWKANGKTEYGLIAEEVNAVDPLLARRAPDEDGNDTIPVDVDYSKVGVMLINVIKDQQAQITALETRIAALEG